MYVCVVFVGVLFAGNVFASESNGTIDVTNKLARVCQNAACTSYSTINWRPTVNSNTPGALAVAITDTGLTGHIWSDSIGWVNLAPTGGGVTINPTTGVLSGKAFANVGSWINFSPTTVGGGTQVGVTINSSGQFVGWAYVSGVHGGWMKFDCAGVGTCVQTDWRPIPNRAAAPSGGGGGGGGGGFFGAPITTNTTQTSQPTKLQTTPKTTGGGAAEAGVVKKCSMRTIPPGTRHADVAKIQAFLVQQGYLFAALDAKGYYGGGTRASMVHFKRSITKI